MLPTPCYVIGDVHLGVAPPEAESDLLRLLRAIPVDGKSLVIMGDLFDFWFAWGHVMPRVGFRTLAALAELQESGTPVLWIGGNHDCWGGDVLQTETGISYTLDPWLGRIGPWYTMLAHGDGLREKEDAPYRRLRRVLRHRGAIRAFSWLHPDIATWIAAKSSDTSRGARARDGGAGLLSIGSAVLAQPDGPKVVVHGHSHVPILRSIGDGVYANAGAWYLDRQYLVIEDEAITLRQWSKDAPPEVLGRVIPRDEARLPRP